METNFSSHSDGFPSAINITAGVLNLKSELIKLRFSLHSKCFWSEQQSRKKYFLILSNLTGPSAMPSTRIYRSSCFQFKIIGLSLAVLHCFPLPVNRNVSLKALVDFLFKLINYLTRKFYILRNRWWYCVNFNRFKFYFNQNIRWSAKISFYYWNSIFCWIMKCTLHFADIIVITIKVKIFTMMWF